MDEVVLDPVGDAEKRHRITEGAARALLSRSSHFRGRTECFVFIRQDDVLIVEGTVRTFYLKQVLQCVLKHLDDVRRIDNRVTVVFGDGASAAVNITTKLTHR